MYYTEYKRGHSQWNWFSVNAKESYTKEVMIGPGNDFPDGKAHGANMGPTWGRQDPGVPHVDPINIAIRFGAIRQKDITRANLRQYLYAVI